MSTVGYNGNAVVVELDGDPIAAITAANTNFVRTPVEVPRFTDDGWMRLLPRPGRREVNTTIEGVVTEDNLAVLLNEWSGNVLQDVTLTMPDGSTVSAADGFFLGDVEFAAPEDGFVSFSSSLRSSGVVTVTPATP